MIVLCKKWSVRASIYSHYSFPFASIFRKCVPVTNIETKVIAQILKQILKEMLLNKERKYFHRQRGQRPNLTGGHL